MVIEPGVSSTGAMRVKRIGLLFPLLIGVVFGSACEEIDVVLSYRTPLFVTGSAEMLPLAGPLKKIPSSILSNEGWKPLTPFDELPARFALRTGRGSRVQILLRDEGILDVYSDSLLAVNSCKVDGVRMQEGRCAFIKLPKPLTRRYRRLKGSRDRARMLQKLKEKYVRVRQGMFFIRNPFRIKTSFTSSVARKGKTFGVLVDSNHKLHFKRFRLARLSPSFVPVKVKGKKHGSGYRYMAVTGLDIYERTRSLYFEAAARDQDGNWVKLRNFIPTVNFRYSYLKGVTLRHGFTLQKKNRRFKKRYLKRIKRLCKNKKFRKKYKNRLYWENKPIAFYWKSVRVLKRRKEFGKVTAHFLKIFRHSSKQKQWKGRFIVPASGIVTSGFGRYRYYYGGRSSLHKGIDIAAGVGGDILAPNHGKIVYTGNTPARGNNLIIDHGMGVYTCFFHLSRIYVQKGDKVQQGDIVAAIGNSGLSSGAHVHWEMLVNGRRVNPMQWVQRVF